MENQKLKKTKVNHVKLTRPMTSAMRVVVNSTEAKRRWSLTTYTNAVHRGIAGKVQGVTTSHDYGLALGTGVGIKTSL